MSKVWKSPNEKLKKQYRYASINEILAGILIVLGVAMISFLIGYYLTR